MGCEQWITLFFWSATTCGLSAVFRAIVYCYFASVLILPKVTGSQRSKVNCICVCMCLGLSFGFCDIYLFVRPNISDSFVTKGLAIFLQVSSSNAVGRFSVPSLTRVYSSCNLSSSQFEISWCVLTLSCTLCLDKGVQPSQVVNF